MCMNAFWAALLRRRFLLLMQQLQISQFASKSGRLANFLPFCGSLLCNYRYVRSLQAELSLRPATLLDEEE